MRLRIRDCSALPQGLIDRLGAEKMSMFADLMHTVAENFQEMLTERNQTEQEKEDSQKRQYHFERRSRSDSAYPF